MRSFEKDIFLLANERLVAYSGSSAHSKPGRIDSRRGGNIQELMHKIKKDEDIYRAYHAFGSPWGEDKK